MLPTFASCSLTFFLSYVYCIIILMSGAALGNKAEKKLVQVPSIFFFFFFFFARAKVVLLLQFFTFVQQLLALCHLSRLMTKPTKWMCVQRRLFVVRSVDS